MNYNFKKELLKKAAKTAAFFCAIKEVSLSLTAYIVRLKVSTQP